MYQQIGFSRSRTGIAEVTSWSFNFFHVNQCCTPIINFVASSFAVPLKLIDGDSDAAIISSSSSSLFANMWGSYSVDSALVCSPYDQTADRCLLLLSLLGDLLVSPSVAVCIINVLLCSGFFMRRGEWSNVSVRSRLGTGVIFRVAAASPTVCIELGLGISPNWNEFVLVSLTGVVSCISSVFLLIFSEISFNFLWCSIELSIFFCADWLLVSMS